VPSTFPAPTDYYGGYDPQPSPVLFGGQSTYSGFLVVSMLPRPLVESVLPAQLSLATPKSTAAEHPVIHLVGHQRYLVDVVQGVATGIRPLPDYQEMIVLVPLVEYNGTWHNYALRMYLDNMLAVNGGNFGYAYSKELGALEETISGAKTTTQVSVGGAPYFSSVVSRTSAWHDTPAAIAAIPRWTDLHEYMSMPILGTDNLVGPQRILCSYFEWDFSQSSFATAVSEHEYQADFRPPLMSEWVTLGKLTNAVDGAIAVRDIRWRLIHPPAPDCS